MAIRSVPVAVEGIQALGSAVLQTVLGLGMEVLEGGWRLWERREGRGSGRQEPQPVGRFLTEREKVVMVLDVMMAILGEEVGNLEEMVKSKLPPEKAPTPPKSPTEQQRIAKDLEMLNQQEKLEKEVGEGKNRLDKARTKVVGGGGETGEA